MILPCRGSPMTGTVACLNKWAVLGSSPPPPRKATPSKARDTRLEWSTPDEDVAGALPFVCDAWHVRSKLRHNQSVTWLRSESMSACRMPAPI